MHCSVWVWFMLRVFLNIIFGVWRGWCNFKQDFTHTRTHTHTQKHTHNKNNITLQFLTDRASHSCLSLLDDCVPVASDFFDLRKRLKVAEISPFSQPLYTLVTLTLFLSWYLFHLPRSYIFPLPSNTLLTLNNWEGENKDEKGLSPKNLFPCVVVFFLNFLFYFMGVWTAIL
jgi:hypothetical protein